MGSINYAIIATTLSPARSRLIFYKVLPRVQHPLEEVRRRFPFPCDFLRFIGDRAFPGSRMVHNGRSLYGFLEKMRSLLGRIRYRRESEPVRKAVSQFENSPPFSHGLELLDFPYVALQRAFRERRKRTDGERYARRKEISVIDRDALHSPYGRTRSPRVFFHPRRDEEISGSREHFRASRERARINTILSIAARAPPPTRKLKTSIGEFSVGQRFARPPILRETFLSKRFPPRYRVNSP